MTMHKPPGRRLRMGFLTKGEVAEQWGKSRAFVTNLVDEGLLVPEDSGHFSNEELARFHRANPGLLDA